MTNGRAARRARTWPTALRVIDSQQEGADAGLVLRLGGAVGSLSVYDSSSVQLPPSRVDFTTFMNASASAPSTRRWSNVRPM